MTTNKRKYPQNVKSAIFRLNDPIIDMLNQSESVSKEESLVNLSVPVLTNSELLKKNKTLDRFQTRC